MSDKTRLLSRKADLEAIRRANLDRARDLRDSARRYRADRDRPSNPTRAYEHQRECDQKGAEAERQADRSDREAENVLNEIRGLERAIRDAS